MIRLSIADLGVIFAILVGCLAAYTRYVVDPIVQSAKLTTQRVKELEDADHRAELTRLEFKLILQHQTEVLEKTAAYVEDLVNHQRKVEPDNE